MADSTSPPNPTPKPDNEQEALPSPLRCLTGALISGGFASGCYLLTSSIAQTYAGKPIASTNPTAINIAIAIRTLVVGVTTLATALFSFITVGLVVLGIYVLIQQIKNRKASSSDAQ